MNVAHTSNLSMYADNNRWNGCLTIKNLTGSSLTRNWSRAQSFLLAWVCLIGIIFCLKMKCLGMDLVTT